MDLPPTVTEPWVADCWSVGVVAGAAALASSAAKAGRLRARPSNRDPVIDMGFIEILLKIDSWLGESFGWVPDSCLRDDPRGDLDRDFPYPVPGRRKISSWT